ncbi:MAG: SUMF1/EgtB/PvdO family nonheme iron enzyme [Ignavibacteriales bacterium]|nr:SUMF1/EgtB/PvdO family nonheme iron enzyme [Ignavibacteria bacterium]MBW7874328.1 SUMF1/EgtB/PvdO family nonheme iron enzyme [Ignavibacteria bacterium]MCZ2143893.1 SUMF1/EgtB/PvdO family nonheme iron enzyme [Ignavibacteriales bacterium]
MISRLAKISLFIMLFTTLLHPQLKELIVRPTENRGGIPILRNNPDQAGIIFYSQFDNLSFYSTYGITKITGDPEHGKYILVIEPTRQTIEVRAPGYKTEMIKIYSIEPREFLFYEVLPKKEEITGVAEVAITIQATPSDATILLDGAPFPNNTTTKVSVGTHNLTAEKGGYAPFYQEIDVNPDNTLFSISLEKVQLTPVTIRSNPTNATVYINNEQKGTTEVGFFLFPGVYDIRVELPDYLPVQEKLTVRATTDKTVNVFNYNLTRNKGHLDFTVKPAEAVVTLNGKSITPGNYELDPGKYLLEAKVNYYAPFSEEIEIKIGETLRKNVVLNKVTGTFELSVTPSTATITLDGKNISPGVFELNPGKYQLEVRANQYLTHSEEIEIQKGEKLKKEIILIKNTGILELSVTPSAATITLDGKNISPGVFELNPGKYQLEVRANQYLTHSEEIEIQKGEKLKKEIILIKNTGILELTVTPQNASILINKEKKEGNKFELISGLYEIEIAAGAYYPETFTVQIERGKTEKREIALRQKTGILQFVIKPLSAVVELSQNGVQKYKWEGLNLLDPIQEGEYDLTAKATGYKTYKETVTIKENQTTVTEIEMTAGSDAPEGMVFVEGGTFTMGCTSEQGDDCYYWEKPVHQVTMSDFYIGKYEVTQELWVSVMGSNPSDFKGSKLPVERVSWYEAVEFCNRLSDKEGLQRAYSGSGANITCDFNANGYRLPTEAEWEYAARGGKQTKNYKYSGSDNTGAVAWYGDNSGDKTHEVGLKQPNEIGIYDMSGNVWEWCWDWYGDYTSPSQTNPKGPSSGTSRVLRGGSWGNDARRCRVASRGNLLPDIRYSNNGFRLARTR